MSQKTCEAGVTLTVFARRLRDLGGSDPEIWQVLAAIPMEVVRRQFLGADIP
ncbi:MAG: hypothetical protein WCJ75_02955 [Desulfomonile sp.]|jgi:uncharacterized membrane protein YhaH (DUF805 family)